MNFRDKGIIISKHSFKESSLVVTLLTESNGIHSSLFRSKKSTSNILEGNIVDYFWQARLDDQLGFGKCELIKSYNASLMMNKSKLYAFNSIVSLIKASFAEREAHPTLFYLLKNYIELMRKQFCFSDYFSMELAILEEAGYGLDLSKCADTGLNNNLCYVSPKSGKAVSKSSGVAFASKLLALPEFLSSKQNSSGERTEAFTKKDIEEASNLSGYFFQRYIFQGKKLPIARYSLIDHLLEICEV